jgi:hypothetical protein
MSTTKLTAKQERLRMLQQRVTEQKEILKSSAKGAAVAPPENRVLDFAGVGSSTSPLSRSKVDENSSRSLMFVPPEAASRGRKSEVISRSAVSPERKPVARFVPEAAAPGLSRSKTEEKPRSLRLAASPERKSERFVSPEAAAPALSRSKTVRFVPPQETKTKPEEPTEEAQALTGSKARFVPLQETKPEKKKNWLSKLFSFSGSSENKDPPAQPEKASMGDMLFGMRQKNPSATLLDVEDLDSSLKASGQRSSLTASGRSSLTASGRSSSPDLFGSHSKKELEAFAFVQGDDRSSLSQNFAKSLEASIRPSSRDDPATPTGQSRRRTLSSSSKVESTLDPLAFAALSSSKEEYEYECSVEDMEIINRLRELVEADDDFLEYLRNKQSESGLEGKKFIDFLEYLSSNPDMTYERYVLNYEKAYDEEVKRQMHSDLPPGKHEAVSSLRGIFPIIPAKYIIELLANYPRANGNELVATLESFPQDLCCERESNHSFKEAIRAAIKAEKTTKVEDNGDCFFECISIGLNSLTIGEEKKRTARNVREEISRAEFNHFDSVAFRKPTMSFPIGYGVFSNWTDVELVDLTKSINDETGLKIGDEKLRGVRRYPVDYVAKFGNEAAYNVQIVESNRQDNGAPEHVFKFETPKEYAAIMRINGVHATNVEMMVAARLYNVTIVVYIANMEEFYYYFPKKEECGNGRIIYLFKTHAIGHFDVVNMPDIFKIFNHYGLPIASYISNSCVRGQTGRQAVALDTEERENAGQLPEELNQAIYAYLTSSEGKFKKYVDSDGRIKLVPYGDLEGDKTRRMRYFTILGVHFFKIPEDVESKTFEKYIEDENDEPYIEMYEFVLQKLREYNQWVGELVTRSKRRSAVSSERETATAAKLVPLDASDPSEKIQAFGIAPMKQHGQPDSASLERRLSAAASSERETAAAAASSERETAAAAKLRPLAASVKYPPSEQIQAFNIVRASSSPSASSTFGQQQLAAAAGRHPLAASVRYSSLEPMKELAFYNMTRTSPGSESKQEELKQLLRERELLQQKSASDSALKSSALGASFDTSQPKMLRHPVSVPASSASLQQQKQQQEQQQDQELQQKSASDSALESSALRAKQFAARRANFEPASLQQKQQQEQLRLKLLREQEQLQQLIEQERLQQLLEQQTASASVPKVSALRANFEPVSRQQDQEQLVKQLQQQNIGFPATSASASGSNVSAFRANLEPVSVAAASSASPPSQQEQQQEQDRRLQIQVLQYVIIPQLEEELRKENDGWFSADKTKVKRLEGLIREHKDELAQLESKNKGGKMNTTRQTRQRRGKNAKMTTRQTRQRRGKNAKMTTTKQTRQRRGKNAKMTTRRRRN